MNQEYLNYINDMVLPENISQAEEIETKCIQHKIPNFFLHNKFNDTYNIPKIVLPIYILIDQYKTYNFMSYISIGKILISLNYKLPSNKKEAFYKVIKSLIFLEKINYIKIYTDITKAGYDTLIQIQILKAFYRTNYTYFSSRELDNIIANNSCNSLSVKIDNLLYVYLYVKSFMDLKLCIKNNTLRQEFKKQKDNNIYVFWKSLIKISNDICLNKNTVIQGLKILCDDKNGHALLRVKSINFLKDERDHHLINLPCLYALNRDGYENDLKKAEDFIRSHYTVSNGSDNVGGNYIQINDGFVD